MISFISYPQNDKIREIGNRLVIARKMVGMLGEKGMGSTRELVVEMNSSVT